MTLASLYACKAPNKGDQIKKEIPNYNNQFDLKIGDLLFQDLDCGPFCDAIEKVTYGVNGASFSHNGLISKIDNGRIYVLEAVSKGVIETPLDSFLIRSLDINGNPKVLVGRLRDTFAMLGPQAVIRARTRLGAAYDDHFDIMNDRYYCSELIYYAFKEANEGKAVFQLRPMTFNDPDTKEPFPQWVTYYNDLNSLIPEGQPGLNPGSMSRSFYINIVHAYGMPAGWRKPTPNTN